MVDPVPLVATSIVSSTSKSELWTRLSVPWDSVNSFLDSKWGRIVVVTGAGVGTYFLVTYLARRVGDKVSPSASPSVHVIRDLSRPSTLPYSLSNGSISGGGRTPVQSRARIELDSADGNHISLDGEDRPAFTSPPHESLPLRRFRIRSDSLTSAGTTTLLLTNRSPNELLLYGLESLKRAIRLFEESRTRINNTLMEEENVTSASRENSIDEELEFILEKAKQLADDVESYRNDVLPTIQIDHSPIHDMDEVGSRLEHRSFHGSNLSISTTLTLPYFDIEPNLHFFKLYTTTLDNFDNLLLPRFDRSLQVRVESYQEFVAKVDCIRRAFDDIFTQEENVTFFYEIGKYILETVLSYSLRDPTMCISAYEALLEYVSDPDNKECITEEIAVRNIPSVSFYDLVLDYMILESFDDLDNPPSAVTSVANNKWLSSGFRELALQTAVSAVLKHKRSKLKVKEGFFENFYNILEHMSPVLAWGFLGSDLELKLKCNLIKDSVTNLIRGYFSFDRVRYTSLHDLSEDIMRITEEEYHTLLRNLKTPKHNT